MGGDISFCFKNNFLVYICVHDMLLLFPLYKIAASVDDR